jgi:hypothetical protein
MNRVEELFRQSVVCHIGHVKFPITLSDQVIDDLNVLSSGIALEVQHLHSTGFERVMIHLHARPVKDYLVPVAARPVLAGTKEEWILYQRNPSPFFHGRMPLEQLMRINEANVHLT